MYGLKMATKKVKLNIQIYALFLLINQVFPLYTLQMDKKLILQHKKSIKMSLRDHSQIKHKKFVQYDEQQEEKIIQSKSRKWWQKLDKRYFPPATRQELQCLKNTITEDYYLPYEGIAAKQQSFFSKNIQSKHPRLFERKNIKVLFQNNQAKEGQPETFFIAYAFGIKYSQEQQQLDMYVELSQECQQIPEDIKLTFMKEKQPQFQQNLELQQIASQIQLSFVKSTTDIDFLTQCNYYDLTKDLHYSSQIDRQIDLWQQQLTKIKYLNNQAWKNAFLNLQNDLQQQNKKPIVQKIKQGYDTEQDVHNIHQFLKWQHNLVNFKFGFGEKNLQMFADALEGMWVKQNQQKYMGQKKKFFKASIQNLMLAKSELCNTFQTDCKICFSTYVSQKNKVIYCDSCNQSFHQQCYGIQNLDEDPNSKFFCDPCLNQMHRKQGSRNAVCQICFVQFSPLKQFSGHYFHPSCLFLNNMLSPKLGNLQLETFLTAEDIVQMVKKYETSNEFSQCQYCTQNCKKGLKFKCAQADCENYFHLICAYLNAAVFNIWRNNQKLQVEVRCSQHFPEREHQRQVYLRRFFCNYKKTSDLSENQLIQIYQQQCQAREEYKQEMKCLSDNTRIKKIKITQKHQRQTSEYEYIDLDSDDDLQNTNYQQTAIFLQKKTSSQKEIKQNSTRSSSSVQKLKADFDNLREYYQSSKKKWQIPDFSCVSLNKLSSYLQEADGGRTNSENYPKQDFCSQAQMNTSSNDSLKHSNKIILE